VLFELAEATEFLFELQLHFAFIRHGCSPF
jgi:hypothetical protein